MTYDLHKFYIGQSFDAWTYFGAHKLRKNYVFRVYAPKAYKVKLIGSFSDWKALEMKQKELSGVWEVRTGGVKPGDLYKYKITGADGITVDHFDPFAFSSEKRPGTASVVVDLNYKFNDRRWMKERELGYNDPINIYEIHLGSWRKKEDGSCYSYAELKEPLADYLKENHYTHVEFMPLTEYPSDSSWGYQVLGFYSATSRYGTPNQLMELIDYLHRENIGVILDFVPVHFALDDYGLVNFDGTALYEYPEDDIGKSEWGTHNFNFYRGEVRSFLQSAADFWMDVYHIDGIRMDAISRAIYWQGNNERGVNEGAIEFIQTMNQGLTERFPSVMKIAEDSTNYLKVTAPVEYEGLGFNYKWDLGWMNDTLEFLQYFNKWDRGGFINKIEWSMFYFFNEHYLLPLSHDEVVHGKGSILGKMMGNNDEKWLQIRLLYLYMITHPGKKLNFMGNELAPFTEWNEYGELPWDLLQYEAHRDYNFYVKALNEFYLETPELFRNDYNPAAYMGVGTSRYEVIAYARGEGKEKILTILNFGGEDLKDVRINYPEKASFKTCFKTSDWIQEVDYDTREDKSEDNSILVDLTAFGGMVLKVSEERLKLTASRKPGHGHYHKAQA